MKQFFLISLVVFCSLAKAETTAVQIALNWKPEPQFGGFYAMQVIGADQKEGLKTELLEGGSGTPTIQMLANGKVDFAVVSSEEIIISNDRNPKNPVVAVYAVYQTNPQIIMCHKSSGFKNLQEVFASNSVLAIQSGLTYAQYLKAKYPQSKLKFVPYLGGLTNYLSDPHFCQQGFATSEPLVAEKSGKPAQVYLVSEEGFNPYTTVLAVRAETLKTKSELVTKVVRAVKAGWTSYLKDSKVADERMGALNKSMDADTFQKSAQAQKALIEKDNGQATVLGKMTPQRWEKLLTQLRDLKVIKNPDLKAESLFRNID